ncbi:hypothetical protein [Granulicoccus sp. GXG6511]|uniref:hypothetical protein n=1 Tax=Granulicoccus sp. GXG6511 TaxID=3381351 RepID=UPI003D7DF32B
MTTTPDPLTPGQQPTETPAEPADLTAGMPSCLAMAVGLVLAVATGWFMLNVVGTGLHDRFMPPEQPLATLDVSDCLHVPQDADPIIVYCGDTDSEEAPDYAVQALVPSAAECYRVPESEAVLTLDRMVACLGPGPNDADKPRSAAGARAGLCRNDEHPILGWQSRCGKSGREALLVFRTDDHATDPREQCLARGAEDVDIAEATRLVDLTTRPATELPDAQIVCIAPPRE